LRHASNIYFLLEIKNIFVVVNKSITSNLPFRSVIAEETDTVLSTSNANTFMKDSQASSQVLSALMDGLVVLPNVGTEGLGLGVPWTTTETFVIGNQSDY
jgi:hypothetical protein